MNRTRFLTWSVVLLLLLNAGTLLYLFMSHRMDKNERMSPPGKGSADFIVEKLKLDAPQQEQFADLRRQHQDAMYSIQKKDRELHDMYFGLLKSDDPDMAKVDSVSKLIAEQRSQLESATFDHFRQLRNICRDDQKKLFDATIDEIARSIAPKGPRPEGGGPPPPERPD